MPATIVESNETPFRRVNVDPIDLDIIENALRSARHEMDAVLFRTAMSPGIREQHDEFPLIANRDGKMVVGQFGAFIHTFLQKYEGEIYEGDVFLTNDPYSCDGAISHTPDWLVLMPTFKRGRVIGWAAMFGHMTDSGGRTPGSMPTDGQQIFEEGIIIPPLKLYDRGELQSDILELILHNCRIPEWNRSDLHSLIAGCRLASGRMIELSDRFGDDIYYSALEQLLERHEARHAQTHCPQHSRGETLLRGLGVRRWHGHGPLPDCLQHVARRRQDDHGFRGDRAAVVWRQ